MLMRKKRKNNQTVKKYKKGKRSKTISLEKIQPFKSQTSKKIVKINKDTNF